MAAATIPLQRKVKKKRIHTQCVSRYAEFDRMTYACHVLREAGSGRGSGSGNTPGILSAIEETRQMSQRGGVAEVDRETNGTHVMLCLLLLLFLLLLLLLLRLVMWVVWVINEFMFNLNLDQLAWATGSAWYCLGLLYPYSC